MADGGSSNQVRFGVIGTGGMGSFHIGYLQKMAEARLEAGRG